MGKLDDLITELCPDGVEYKTIEQVFFTISAPRKILRKDYQNKGLYPIIDQGQNFIVGYTDDETSVLELGTYVIFGEHTRIIKYVDFQFAQGADGLKILIPASKQFSAKYMYYAFSNLKIPSRGYNRHWTIAKDLCIPVPPLPIQDEIVRILDRFTELETELEAELEAELKLRKKQYEYYRNKLLSFKVKTSQKLEET